MMMRLFFSLTDPYALHVANEMNTCQTIPEVKPVCPGEMFPKRVISIISITSPFTPPFGPPENSEPPQSPSIAVRGMAGLAVRPPAVVTNLGFYCKRFFFFQRFPNPAVLTSRLQYR